MPLPKLKPVFDAANEAYQYIVDNKGIIKKVGALAGSYVFGIPDTSPVKMEALSKLKMPDEKSAATDTAEENKQLIAKLSEVKIPAEDNGQFKALHAILTHCGKMVSDPRKITQADFYHATQESLRVLFASILPSTHNFFLKLGMFREEMEVYARELLDTEHQVKLQTAQKQARQAALDEAKKEKELLLAEHQVKLQAVQEQARQAVLDEAKKEKELLLTEHQAKLQTQEQTHQAALAEVKKQYQAIDQSLNAAREGAEVTEKTLKETLREMARLSEDMVASARETKEDKQKIRDLSAQLSQARRELAELQYVSQPPQARKQMMARQPAKVPDKGIAGSGFGLTDPVKLPTPKASGSAATADLTAESDTAAQVSLLLVKRSKS